MRLVRSLRHTLDYMGLPTPRFPCSSFNEVLLLPAYAPDCDGCTGDQGLLMYSAATHGWAPLQDDRDPRPDYVRAEGIVAKRRWLAAVLRSKYTSAGEAAAAGGPGSTCTTSCSSSCRLQVPHMSSTAWHATFCIRCTVLQIISRTSAWRRRLTGMQVHRSAERLVRYYRLLSAVCSSRMLMQGSP